MNPTILSRGRALTHLALVLAVLFVSAKDLHSASVELPADITAEQAKALAAEQSGGLDHSRSSLTAPAAVTVIDSMGRIDPMEGAIRKSDGKDPNKVAKPLPPADSMRWGQRLFASADPSLFASHVGAVGSSYTLGSGDQIILTIWGEKEARYDLTLDRDGQVRIELIGAVSLSGQTLTSADELLRKRLSKVYAGLNSGATEMDLTLGKLKQVRVFVLGDAVNPGSFLLSGNTSVFAALFQARGPSALGTERSIVLERSNKETRVDLYDYLAKGRRPAQDILQDGDILRIPRRGKVVRIAGDVGRPGLYEMLDSEGAKELLEFAGGINATTATTGMVASRIQPGGRRESVLMPSPQDILNGARVEVQDGDSLHVFAGADSSRNTVTVRGLVRFPGSYPLKDGLTAQGLVSMAGGALPAAYAPRILVTRTRFDGSLEQFRAGLGDSSSSTALEGLDLVEVFDSRDLVVKRNVRISGAVIHPGEYPWKDGMTVKDLILQSGGFRFDADFGKVRLETPLSHSRGAQEEWIELDSSLLVSTADRVLSPDVHLSVPNDPNHSRLEPIEVIGWVVHPGSYSLRRTDERLTEVLTRAGGILPEGYAGGSRLLRGEGKIGRIQVKFLDAIKNPGSKFDLVLRGGDTIVVPKRPATLTVAGRVNNPGSVIWTEGKSWSWYLEQAGGPTDSADEKGIYVEFADGSIETREGGISTRPNPGSVIHVPFRKPPEPTSFTDKVGALNTVLATVIAGLTIFVLMTK